MIFSQFSRNRKEKNITDKYKRYERWRLNRSTYCTWEKETWHWRLPVKRHWSRVHPNMDICMYSQSSILVEQKNKLISLHYSISFAVTRSANKLTTWLQWASWGEEKEMIVHQSFERRRYVMLIGLAARHSPHYVSVALIGIHATWLA